MSVVANFPDAETLDILVVEDLPASQKLFSHILRAAGHRVRLAANGLEAIRSFRGRRPDLIVMDLQMPILDGLQTSTILRLLQSPASQVPIIATTACGPVFDRDRFSRIGVEAFLPKPIRCSPACSPRHAINRGEKCHKCRQRTNQRETDSWTPIGQAGGGDEAVTTSRALWSGSTATRNC